MADTAVPGRRGLQICLGVVWLLDAALQYQPFMFGPFFVTLESSRRPKATRPSSPTRRPGQAKVMLKHIALYNAIFATIQLLIAAGILWRRTVRPALAASIVWSLFVWWFGESLGGILIGSSPLVGVPGGVVLYALHRRPAVASGPHSGTWGRSRRRHPVRSAPGPLMRRG